ncbi:hypothetical protein JQX13_46960 [Archangium violaceum]|nr:hypothetical protein JQX13_46960 [Archangium violaceum]
MTLIELREATLSLTLSQSRHGVPQPQLEVILPASAVHRQLRAALHAFSASLELATPASERWLVQMEILDAPRRGRLYLELAEGSHPEAMRGLMLLHTLMG